MRAAYRASRRHTAMASATARVLSSHQLAGDTPSVGGRAVYTQAQQPRAYRFLPDTTR